MLSPNLPPASPTTPSSMGSTARLTSNTGTTDSEYESSACSTPCSNTTGSNYEPLTPDSERPPPYDDVVAKDKRRREIIVHKTQSSMALPSWPVLITHLVLSLLLVATSIAFTPCYRYYYVPKHNYLFIPVFLAVVYQLFLKKKPMTESKGKRKIAVVAISIGIACSILGMADSSLGIACEAKGMSLKGDGYPMSICRSLTLFNSVRINEEKSNTLFKNQGFNAVIDELRYLETETNERNGRDSSNNNDNRGIDYSDSYGTEYRRDRYIKILREHNATAAAINEIQDSGSKSCYFRPGDEGTASSAYTRFRAIAFASNSVALLCSAFLTVLLSFEMCCIVRRRHTEKEQGCAWI